MMKEADAVRLLRNAKKQVIDALSGLHPDGRKMRFDQVAGQTAKQAEDAIAHIVGHERARQMIEAWRADIRNALKIDAT